MGEILNLRNLKAYLRKVDRGDAPDWPVEDLLYLSIPTLAIRNLDYLEKQGDGRYWALCWKGKKNSKLAFSVAGTILKQWQAFRPHPPDRLLKRIGKHIPNVVSRFQKKIKKLKVRTIRDVPARGYRFNATVLSMAIAVGEIASVKNAGNPMVGSKVLHFMIPEFFPVWDTAWIKRRALAHYRDRHKSVPIEVRKKLESLKVVKGKIFARAALEYASYVNLMLQDLSKTSDKEWRRMIKECLWESEMEPKVMEWHFQNKDISPMLFELCLLGKYC